MKVMVTIEHIGGGTVKYSMDWSGSIKSLIIWADREAFTQDAEITIKYNDSVYNTKSGIKS